MSKPAYIIVNRGSSEEKISGVFNGKPFDVLCDNPTYSKIIEALFTETFDGFEELLNEATALKKYTHGKVTVDGNTVVYNGVEVHGVVVEKILEFMQNKYPVKPIIAFLENLLLNPSRRAINELYTFLVHKGLPITDDGCFLGYKGLRHDYYDIHSGTNLNTVGSIHRMERNEVDDNFGNACSQGLHVGSFQYASDFCGNGKLVLVKVNPKDVVSVPSDAQCQKLRTCEYQVVADCTGQLQEAYVQDTSHPYDNSVVEYDDDYDDGEFDDNEWDEDDEEYKTHY